MSKKIFLRLTNVFTFVAYYILLLVSRDENQTLILSSALYIAAILSIFALKDQKDFGFLKMHSWAHSVVTLTAAVAMFTYVNSDLSMPLFIPLIVMSSCFADLVSSTLRRQAELSPTPFSDMDNKTR